LTWRSSLNALICTLFGAVISHHRLYLIPLSSFPLPFLADMSRPKIGLIAKHVIPQTRFAFTLHRKDIRLLWAINCGSYSLLPLVPIYEPSMLDSQLDAVMRLVCM
jgi:Protein of unknown function, DUF547